MKNRGDSDRWINLSHGLMLSIKRCQVVILNHFTAIPNAGIAFFVIFTFTVVEFDQRIKVGIGIRGVDACDLMAYQLVLIIVIH